jgi:hypothetical protein
MVPHPLQLSVGSWRFLLALLAPDCIPSSFPLNIVFRIYDSCFASGIETIFGFSIALLKKNEEVLMSLKFDQILAYINTQMLQQYMVREGSSLFARDGLEC